MNRLSFLFLLTIPLFSLGSLPQKTHVITHNRATIVTDPKTGEKFYPGWGVFPSAEISVRKIVLHLTLGSPDSMKTAHWDYCDNIFIRRQGGEKSPSRDLEIARMLTPYGSIFGKGWQFEWQVDVTDFASILRDSVEIEYRHTGYEPDTVGWALTLDFEVIEGPEVAKPLGITNLWQGNYKYGDPADPIEEKLLPRSFEAMTGSGFSRIRIQHTGHGMDEPRGCSEFCSRWRDFYYDDKVVDHRVLWKDCGNNPLYPQGGTWVYDRANWCPGDLQQPDLIHIPSAPGTHALSIKMEPYTATGNIQAVENITAYLIQYSEPRQKTDVALEEILVPNDDPFYVRKNPTCFNPQVKFRNLGSDVLTSLSIEYGTSGFEKKVFQWTGKLAFNEAATVILPGTISSDQGKNKFAVALVKPNGKKDGWAGDNAMTTSFQAPRLLPSSMVIRLKTNKHPGDNTLLLVNDKRDTVYRKLPSALKPDTIYNDTIHLAAGQYHCILTDTTGDGLEFWAEPDQGNGYLRLLDLNGRLLHPFQSDCGNGEMVAFKAVTDFVRDTSVRLNTFSLYPRKVKDKTELEVVSDRQAAMTVIITVDGKVVERHEYGKILSGTFVFYLGYLPKGRIVLEALLDGKSCFKGRIFKSE